MRARDLVAVAALLLGPAGCGEEPPAVAAAPPAATAAEDAAPHAAEEVEVVPVAAEPLTAAFTATGSVMARRTTAVAPEVPGRIVEVRVEVGDRVEAGDVLFRIDPAPFELALAEAEAALELARAELHDAEQEAARVEHLLERQAISERRAERARTAAAVARARVAQMEARVARARHDLARTAVRAPFAGSVVGRFADEGAMAGGEPVLLLQETGSLEAVVAIPEAWPAPARVGDEVLLRAASLDSPVPARIARVSDRVDEATRTYEVRAPIPPSVEGLRAGSYVEAEVRVHTAGAVPVVPRSALVVRDGRTFAFRVAGGRVEAVPVRTGLGDATRVSIRSGLEVGDEVVVGEAAARLRDGDAVRPVRPRARTARAVAP